MIHHRQRLSLVFEVACDLSALVSIPSLMIFSATRLRTGLFLLGHVDGAEPAFHRSVAGVL